MKHETCHLQNWQPSHKLDICLYTCTVTSLLHVMTIRESLLLEPGHCYDLIFVLTSFFVLTTLLSGDPGILS